MPTPPIHQRDLQKAANAFKQTGNMAEAARLLKLPESTYKHRFKCAVAAGLIPEKKPAEFSFTPLPDDDVSLDELVEHRKRKFAQLAAHETARKLIDVQIGVKGAIGILHVGDPHVDDDGTDIAALERHTALVNETEGMFAANVGDTTNNWVGRLAGLYAEQSTSAKQAWRLAEWFVTRCDWLYMLGGNHDAWSGAGDPLKWITRQTQSIYQSSEARLALRFPNGRSVRINARHDFAGHSQYNPAHGPIKATMFGVRDHIAIAGHRHVSGYGIIKDPDTGIACHAIKVASYKIYDRYARDKGFRDQSLSPCVVTVIDPALPDTHPDLVKVFWEPEEGAAFLRWKRQRKAA